MTSQFLVSMLTITVILHVILLACAYLIFLERKVSAWAQDRTGPNRTNFSFGLYDIWNRIPGLRWFMSKRHFGLGQALADGLKLILKEDYTPPHVDRALFIFAPIAAVIPAMIAWAVVPWGGMYVFPELTIPNWVPLWGGAVLLESIVTVSVAPIHIGLIYILAMSSLGVYGVVLAGYASNNKYSFLGGFRATAQMISYEIPLGLIVLIMILTYATTDPNLFVNLQAGTGGAGAWGIFVHPLLAVIFFIAILAETNRAPFDLAEAEQELVGGFHTEYGSMKWALFFLGEYMHMITGCALFALLFLGGWDLLPFVTVFPLVTESLAVVLLKVLIFAAKVTLLIFLMMWIRWTLPRLRFDQLMGMCWRSLIPAAIVLLLLTGFVIFLDLPLPGVWLLAANVAVAIAMIYLEPRISGGRPGNQRLPMEGSRFYSPEIAAQEEARKRNGQTQRQPEPEPAGA